MHRGEGLGKEGKWPARLSWGCWANWRVGRRCTGSGSKDTDPGKSTGWTWASQGKERVTGRASAAVLDTGNVRASLCPTPCSMSSTGKQPANGSREVWATQPLCLHWKPLPELLEWMDHRAGPGVTPTVSKDQFMTSWRTWVYTGLCHLVSNTSKSCGNWLMELLSYSPWCLKSPGGQGKSLVTGKRGTLHLFEMGRKGCWALCLGRSWNRSF